MNMLAKTSKPQKSLALGFLLGLIPGVGLFYAAPIATAALATLFVTVTLTVVGWFGWIPLLGWLIGKLAFMALSLGSGVLGLLYATANNKAGQRQLLSREAEGEPRLPL